ncbi:MAG: putative sugar nucleotidyl transferase [Bacteroidota bacterium]
MYNIILFDDDSRDRFLPLTFTRPVGELRIGILTIREKWEKWLDCKVSYITQEYLSEKYPIQVESDNYIINSSILPTQQLCALVKGLQLSEAILKDGELIATRLNEKQIAKLMKDEEIEELQGYELDDTPLLRLAHMTDLFQKNEIALREDYELLTAGRVSAALNDSNLVRGAAQIFVEEGAEINCSMLNASTGPIYIGKEVKVLEGSMLRGPLALCEGSVVKMGTKIYGASTFGPHSKIGGELKNVIFQDNSNKGHEGYLGNAVIGAWCNLGAATNASNLKNNYNQVKQWSYVKEALTLTDLQFCGLVMGDYSRSSIGTLFNTATVVGVCANVFGQGLTPKFIPSFSWGSDMNTTFKIEKAIEMAERVMARKEMELSVADRLILVKIFEESSKFRSWEKEQKK